MHAEGSRHSGVIRDLQLRADDLAMGDHLIVNLDLPGAVVGDDDQHRRFMTYGCVNLDGIEAECAVSCRNHDWFVGKSETRGDTIGNADANAAEGTRVEHQRCVETDASEGQKVSAVGYDDGIIADRLLKRRQYFVRMQLAVCAFWRAGHAVLQILRTIFVTGAQFRGPLTINFGDSVSCVLDHRAQGLRRRCENFYRAD